MYTIRWSAAFYRDVKSCKKKHRDMEKFKRINVYLSAGTKLPHTYKDHTLKGNWKGYRECHIEADWLLIYKIDDTKKEIQYVRMGTHDKLFR